MAMLPRNNELTREEIEKIRIRIEDDYRVFNVRLLKETEHSLIFEGIRGNTLAGFIYQKISRCIIEDEGYRVFL